MSDPTDLSGDGGVVKTIVRRPKPDAIAPSDDLPLVDVHYEGVLAENGEVFDTTREDNTIFSFEIGKGSVIKAWEIAVKTMKVGEIAKITCKPEYAYGSAGSPPDIPPDSTLIFEVELLACKPRKGLSLEGAVDERARLEELRKQRELAAATKEEEKKKREEAKAAAAARIQAKMGAKKGQGKVLKSTRSNFGFLPRRSFILLEFSAFLLSSTALLLPLRRSVSSSAADVLLLRRASPGLPAVKTNIQVSRRF